MAHPPKKQGKRAALCAEVSLQTGREGTTLRRSSLSPKVVYPGGDTSGIPGWLQQWYTRVYNRVYNSVVYLVYNSGVYPGGVHRVSHGVYPGGVHRVVYLPYMPPYLPRSGTYLPICLPTVHPWVHTVHPRSQVY